jgi:hypothetical protein
MQSMRITIKEAVIQKNFYGSIAHNLRTRTGTHVEIEQPTEPKTVFLTGAAGFIGSNFYAMFDKYPNYSFIVLDALTYAGNPENILITSNIPIL